MLRCSSGISMLVVLVLLQITGALSRESLDESFEAGRRWLLENRRCWSENASEWWLAEAGAPPVERPVTLDELRTPKQCKGFSCRAQQVCGRAPLNPLTPRRGSSGFIQGGRDAVYGHWPSFAKISVKLPKNMGHLCGAVLIDKRHLLTAAHCVTVGEGTKIIGYVPARDVVVHLGDYRLNRQDRYEQLIQVKHICVASLYSFPKYDYAVLTLNRDATLNDYVQPACLPYKPIQMVRSERCFTVGLGDVNLVNNTKTDYYQRLQQINVAWVDCGKRFEEIPVDDRSRLCFATPKSDASICSGDSGGPVLCLDNQRRWTVVGLASHSMDEECSGSAAYVNVRGLLEHLYADCGV